MRENKTITDLVLRGNCISEDIALAIEERLRENRRVRETNKFVLPANMEIVKSPKMTKKEDLITSIIRDDIFLQTASIRKQRHSTPQRREKLKTRVHQVPVNVLEENSGDNSEVDSEVNLELESDGKINSNVNMNVSSKDCDNKTNETDTKIANLGKILQERTATIDLLTGEIATKVTEVNDTRAQLSLLQTQVNQLQENKEKLDSDKAREIADLQKSHEQAEENWRKNYKNLKNNFNECSRSKKDAETKVRSIILNLSCCHNINKSTCRWIFRRTVRVNCNFIFFYLLSEQVRQYEVEIHRVSLKTELLRDKLVSATRAYDDLLSKTKIEIHRMRREWKESDNKHKIEYNILKNTLKGTIQALEDCQTELQKSRKESRDLFKGQALLKTKLDDAECNIFRLLIIN